MASPPFIELSARSAFSFLEGSSAPEDLMGRAAELGHGALALADAEGVYGLPRFHRAAKAAGVRAIFGARDTFGELWRHRDPDEERANRKLLATGIAPLATGDVRHAYASGKRLLDAFTCIANGAKLDEAGRLLLPNA